MREIRSPGSVRGAARKSRPYRDVAPVKTGRKKQVTEMSRHRRIEEVLPREESVPGKSSPCGRRGDSPVEA